MISKSKLASDSAFLKPLKDSDSDSSSDDQDEFEDFLDNFYEKNSFDAALIDMLAHRSIVQPTKPPKTPEKESQTTEEILP
jgi:hypothetical protein